MSSPPEDRNVLVADRWWSKLPRSVYKNMKRVPVTSEWFEVYLVGWDTFVIYEPGQYEEAISTLVIGSARAALIDTGCGISNIADVVDEITDLPVFVFNTHSHNDHVADNHRFKEIWMLDHPWSVEAQKGLPNSEMAHLVAEGMVWKPLPKGFKKEKYVVLPFKVAHFFKDGEEIDLGGRMLESFTHRCIHPTPAASSTAIIVYSSRGTCSTRVASTHTSTAATSLPSSRATARCSLTTMSLIG